MCVASAGTRGALSICIMTREQELRTKSMAIKAAHSDMRDERRRTKQRGAWWIGELSYSLGIVDARGMVDVDGEVARLFVRKYTTARV